MPLATTSRGQRAFSYPAKSRSTLTKPSRRTNVAAAAGSSLNNASSANDSVQIGPDRRYRCPGDTFCVSRYGGSTPARAASSAAVVASREAALDERRAVAAEGEQRASVRVVPANAFDLGILGDEALDIEHRGAGVVQVERRAELVELRCPLRGPELEVVAHDGARRPSEARDGDQPADRRDRKLHAEHLADEAAAALEAWLGLSLAHGPPSAAPPPVADRASSRCSTLTASSAADSGVIDGSSAVRPATTRSTT